MNNGSKWEKHKQVSIISLIILIIVLLFSYLQFDDYKENIKNYNEIEDIIIKEEDDYIKTLFNEEKKMAEKSLNLIVEKIQNKLILGYGKNLNDLDYDIDNPSPNSYLTKVLDESLRSFYINENTIVNKPFVLSMNSLLWGTFSYENINNNEVPSIEDLYFLQGDSKLNKEAIDTVLLNNDTKYIFWENKSNNELTSMNIDKLIDIYHEKGINYMRNYELLVPVYITKDGDIFGTKDTDGIGHKINNYKIIIVQRINIYDLLKEYSNELSYYNSSIERIDDRAKNNINDKTRSLMINAAIIGLVLFGSAYLQNKKYK